MDSPAINPADQAITGLVDDPEEVTRLFYRLRHQRNLISVRAATGQREFNTILLLLDTGQQYLVLDAPRPRPADGVLDRDVRIYARTHVDGAPLIFVAYIDALLQIERPTNAESDEHDSNLLLRWPTRVSYFQRRTDYRVSVPATLIPQPVRLLVDGKVHQARLTDLSASGVALMIAEPSLALQADAKVPCILPLPAEDLKGNFLVRHTKRVRGGVQVGGEVELNDEADHQRLLRAVMTIERWWIQHR